MMLLDEVWSGVVVTPDSCHQASRVALERLLGDPGNPPNSTTAPWAPDGGEVVRGPISPSTNTPVSAVPERLVRRKHQAPHGLRTPGALSGTSPMPMTSRCRLRVGGRPNPHGEIDTETHLSFAREEALVVTSAGNGVGRHEAHRLGFENAVTVELALVLQHACEPHVVIAASDTRSVAAGLQRPITGIELPAPSRQARESEEPSSCQSYIAARRARSCGLNT